MNKTNILAKTLVTGLACVALCGTTLAAPCGGKAPHKAPMHQKAPTHRKALLPAHRAPAPAPIRYRHTPAPPPPIHHHGGHRHGGNNGLVALGAAVIGGIVGGIVGALN